MPFRSLLRYLLNNEQMIQKTPIKASCGETVVSASMPQFANTTGNITHVLDHTRQTPKRPTESENYLPVTQVLKQKKTDNESLILQRQLVEIEGQRLIIERERLAVEKRRLLIEEERLESVKRQETDNDAEQEPSSFELADSKPVRRAAQLTVFVSQKAKESGKGVCSYRMLTFLYNSPVLYRFDSVSKFSEGFKQGEIKASKPVRRRK